MMGQATGWKTIGFVKHILCNFLFRWTDFYSCCYKYLCADQENFLTVQFEIRCLWKIHSFEVEDYQSQKQNYNRIPDKIRYWLSSSPCKRHGISLLGSAFFGFTRSAQDTLVQQSHVIFQHLSIKINKPQNFSSWLCKDRSLFQEIIFFGYMQMFSSRFGRKKYCRSSRLGRKNMQHT